MGRFRHDLLASQRVEMIANGLLVGNAHGVFFFGCVTAAVRVCRVLTAVKAFQAGYHLLKSSVTGKKRFEERLVNSSGELSGH